MYRRIHSQTPDRIDHSIMGTIGMMIKGGNTAFHRGSGTHQMPPGGWTILPYPWISIEPEQHAKDIEEGDIKGIESTEGALLCWKNQVAHETTDLLTKPPRQEEHASNVDKWATSPETAQGKRSQQILISSIMKKTIILLPNLFSRNQETRWPRLNSS